MKNIFDRETKEQIINRIDSLRLESKQNWGEMTITQMLAHLTRSIKIANGETILQRPLIGKILGPLLKPLYYNDRPYPKNLPLGKITIIPEPDQFEYEKNRLKSIVLSFSEGGESQASKHPHPLFGVLTPEQWGKAVYKHLDHHLTQFSA